MTYYIHARFSNKTSLSLYENDTDIKIEVDANFKPFRNSIALLKRFEELKAMSIKLRKAGKVNQFYLLEAVRVDSLGREEKIKEWQWSYDRDH